MGLYEVQGATETVSDELETVWNQWSRLKYAQVSGLREDLADESTGLGPRRSDCGRL